MLSEEQKKTEQPPAPAGDIVKVTAHRKMTFKNDGDYETIEGFIEGAEPRTTALPALKEWLRRLDVVLAEEKNAKLARAKMPPAKPAPPTGTPTAPAAQQAPTGTGDPYSGLPWRQSEKNKQLGTMRVTEKLDPLGRELYQKLKADKQFIMINEATYRLSVTQKDSQYVPKGTEYLQRWTKARP